MNIPVFVDEAVSEVSFPLMRSHWLIFVFISITLGDGSKKILLQFMSKGESQKVQGD